jgi:hypothetical protein
MEFYSLFLFLFVCSQALKDFRDEVLLKQYLSRFESYANATKKIKNIFAYMVRGIVSFLWGSLLGRACCESASWALVFFVELPPFWPVLLGLFFLLVGTFACATRHLSRQNGRRFFFAF